MRQFTEKEIQHQMECNHCTRKEALDILAWDYDIDHGDKEKGALTQEQKKLVRSLVKADKDPDKKRTIKRERKPDSVKRMLIGIVSTALDDAEIAHDVVNPEKSIDFTFGDVRYTFMLTAHRK